MYPSLALLLPNLLPPPFLHTPSCHIHIGPIWMDDVDCDDGLELLENCSFRGWGIHNCNHEDDVGVVCTPGIMYLYLITRMDHTHSIRPLLFPTENYPGSVSNFTMIAVGATSTTLSWEVRYKSC